MPLLAALWWGWRRFRYGGVVIEGSGAHEKVDVSQAVSMLASRRSRRRAVRDLMAGKVPEIYG